MASLFSILYNLACCLRPHTKTDNWRNFPSCYGYLTRRAKDHTQYRELIEGMLKEFF